MCVLATVKGAATLEFPGGWPVTDQLYMATWSYQMVHTCDLSSTVPERGLIVTCSDAVLQRALVEDVGREGAECGVHAVLHLQADGPDAQHHQALKERL